MRATICDKFDLAFSKYPFNLTVYFKNKRALVQYRKLKRVAENFTE
jgi:hypothetical protein